MRWPVFAAVLLLAACGQPAPTTANQTSSAAPRQTATATASPSGERVGVLIKYASGNVPKYDLTVVRRDGTILTTVHPATRAFITTPGPGPGGAAAIELPYISTSADRVYYLDGDATVKFIALNGSTGSAARIPGTTKAHAAFAVSPDDTRIAVSVLDYSTTPVLLRLYVEDLTTGAHHSDIFSSNSAYVWPIGWHNEQLVLAVGSIYSQQGVAWNPYDAAAYHVVDPNTADRRATMGSGTSATGCQPTGPLSSAGTACFVLSQCLGCPNQSETIIDWNGVARPGLTFSINGQGTGAASPDGGLAICCDDSRHITIRAMTASTQTTPLTGESGDWVCWLDATHVLTGFVSVSQQDQPSVLDLGSGKVTPVNAGGFCAGTVPPYPAS